MPYLLQNRGRQIEGGFSWSSTTDWRSNGYITTRKRYKPKITRSSPGVLWKQNSVQSKLHRFYEYAQDCCLEDAEICGRLFALNYASFLTSPFQSATDKKNTAKYSSVSFRRISRAIQIIRDQNRNTLSEGRTGSGKRVFGITASLMLYGVMSSTNSYHRCVFHGRRSKRLPNWSAMPPISSK